MGFNKGSELDKQIYKEGESTWGCKSGVLDVEDVEDVEDFIDIILKKAGEYTFANPSMHSFMDFIKDKAGSCFHGDKKNE